MVFKLTYTQIEKKKKKKAWREKKCPIKLSCEEVTQTQEEFVLFCYKTKSARVTFALVI